MEGAYIYLFVPSNMGVFERTLALKSEWKRGDPAKEASPHGEEEDTPWPKDFFLFGASCVRAADTSTLWHFKDSLSFLGPPPGSGGSKQNVTLQIVNIFISKLHSFVFLSDHIARERKLSWWKSLPKVSPTVLLPSVEAACLKTPSWGVGFLISPSFF